MSHFLRGNQSASRLNCRRIQWRECQHASQFNGYLSDQPANNTRKPMPRFDTIECVALQYERDMPELSSSDHNAIVGLAPLTRYLGRNTGKYAQAELKTW